MSDPQPVRPDKMPADLADWLRQLEALLERLVTSPLIRFDDQCRQRLPKAHGIYRIFDPKKPNETIRAGRTKTAAGGLRQRVYQNHLMGDQLGNLRMQLVMDRTCPSVEAAKDLMRRDFVVQIFLVPDAAERASLEHFMARSASAALWRLITAHPRRDAAPLQHRADQIDPLPGHPATQPPPPFAVCASIKIVGVATQL